VVVRHRNALAVLEARPLRAEELALPATPLGFVVASAEPPTPEPTEIDDAPTAPIEAGPFLTRAERLAQAVEAAQRAVAGLRMLERMPLSSRETVFASVGDVRRTLAQVRRCLRAFGAEMRVLEDESRELVVAVFERRRSERVEDLADGAWHRAEEE